MPTDLKGFRDRVRVADGAWGTQLQARGGRLGETVEPWNTDRPDDVRAVAAAYVEAGSDIILTNTFRANRFVLEREGGGGRVAELNEAGARLSKAAAGDRALVFGSIGPSGKLLMTREVTEAELLEAFTTQAAALAAGGVDAIVCETFYDLKEVGIALRAVREATELPVVASMTFDSGPDRTRTMMGVPPEQAAEALVEMGADAVGCNCGSGIDDYVTVVGRMRGRTDRPIWAKPNAGLPEEVDGRVVYRETPQRFASRVPDLVSAGADVVGGCCGTTPAFVAAIVEKVRPR